MFAVMAFSSFPPAFGDELGRTVFAGKQIILHNDGTWEYASNTPDGSAKNCTTVGSNVFPVSLCLDPDAWIRAPESLNPMAEMIFKLKHDELYMMVIAEKVFVAKSGMSNIIKNSLQSGAGLHSVQIIKEGELSVGDYNIMQLVSSTIVNGVDVTFINYYTSIEGKGNFQIIFWMSDDNYGKYASFVENIAKTIKIN